MGKIIKIPKDLPNNPHAYNKWILQAIYEFFHLTESKKHAREFDIIENRFFSCGKELTNDELGIIFDVSSKEIEKNEKEALDNLAELINTGVNKSRRIALKKNLYAKTQAYKNFLNKRLQADFEYSIYTHTVIEQNYDISLSLLRLLLPIFGYERDRVDTGIAQYTVIWRKSK